MGVGPRWLRGVAEVFDKPAQLERVDHLLGVQLRESFFVDEGVSHQRFAPQISDRLRVAEGRSELLGHLLKIEVL